MLSAIHTVFDALHAAVMPLRAYPSCVWKSAAVPPFIPSGAALLVAIDRSRNPRPRVRRSGTLTREKQAAFEFLIGAVGRSG